MNESPKEWRCRIPNFDLTSPNRMLRAIGVNLVAYSDDMPELRPVIDLTITRYYGYRKRAFDKDNLYGSSKLLIDAIKDFNIIPDDTPKHINLTVKQEKSPTRETFVEIEAKEADNIGVE